MKSRTSTYYISVETKSKHFSVYEYVKKGKECRKIRSQALSHMYAPLNWCFDKWLQN